MYKKIGVKNVVVSRDIDIINNATKIVLPGVGAFDTGMINLEKYGLIEVLNRKVVIEKTPLLGICLGMQLLTKKSEEGTKDGLGWIDAETVKFNPAPELKLKVPNMGWSYVKVKKLNPLVDINSKNRFYFVHSYYVNCFDESQSLATSDFGIEYTCVVNKNNIYGVQFHPEKSLKFGMKVLENFAKL